MSPCRRTSATRTEWTILECAQAALQVTGAAPRADVVFQPLPEDDPKQRKPDITKARAMLGWEPSVALRDGLNLSLDYFRSKV